LLKGDPFHPWHDVEDMYFGQIFHSETSGHYFCSMVQMLDFTPTFDRYFFDLTPDETACWLKAEGIENPFQANGRDLGSDRCPVADGASDLADPEGIGSPCISPSPSSPSIPAKLRQKGGRRRIEESDNDKRICKGWDKHKYITYENFATETGLAKNGHEVKKVIDRHRHRPGKSKPGKSCQGD
jgi:hypothetical protein